MSSSQVPGIVSLTGSEPVENLPTHCEGLNILVAMGGGLGDALIAVGSVAKYFDGVAMVDAAVMKHQSPVIKQLKGVRNVYQTQAVNNPAFRREYDVYLNFGRVFNNPKNLHQEDYYKLVGNKAGIGVDVGELEGFDVEQGNEIFLHPSASNPNRRWTEEKWEELAFELRDRGYAVTFLGTKDEFGFSADGILKLSDVDEDLLYQVACLAKAKYFIGNDSGFAHCAGLLGVPGAVLFFATRAQDVICRYSSLTGIEVYDKLGVQANSSLNPRDPICLKCIEGMTPGDVLEATGFDTPVVEEGSREKCPEIRLPINLLNEDKCQGLYNHLFKYFDLSGKEDSNITLDVQSSKIAYVTVGDKVNHLSLDCFENIPRALREMRN